MAVNAHRGYLWRFPAGLGGVRQCVQVGGDIGAHVRGPVFGLVQLAVANDPERVARQVLVEVCVW